MSTSHAETLRAIDAALHELGVPGDGYPAPVANAVRILRAALEAEPVVPDEPEIAAPMDALWNELILDACASDGPIRDADVKNAVKHLRPRIEAAAGEQERERQVAVRRDWGTLPHRAFFEKHGRIDRDLYLLPTNCTCRDCQMWST